MPSCGTLAAASSPNRKQARREVTRSSRSHRHREATLSTPCLSAKNVPEPRRLRCLRRRATTTAHQRNGGGWVWVPRVHRRRRPRQMWRRQATITTRWVLGDESSNVIPAVHSGWESCSARCVRCAMWMGCRLQQTPATHEHG